MADAKGVFVLGSGIPPNTRLKRPVHYIVRTARMERYERNAFRPSGLIKVDAGGLA
jgi:hypothetical protein